MTEHQQACLQAIVDNYGTDDVTHLRRSIYRHTDCGAWMSVITPQGQIHSGSVIPEDADIIGLIVGSIVEGVDEGTDEHEIMFDKYETAETCAAAFSKALDEVEAEAGSIWDSTHGCPTCALHWLREAGGDVGDENWKDYADERWQAGDTPIWDKCPGCGGSGTWI